MWSAWFRAATTTSPAPKRFGSDRCFMKGLKHYFIVRFPQRAGALRDFVDQVLGPNDDITMFDYSKKTNREKGPALIGIELLDKDDFPWSGSAHGSQRVSGRIHQRTTRFVSITHLIYKTVLILKLKRPLQSNFCYN